MIKITQIKTKEQLAEYFDYHTKKIVEKYQLINQMNRDAQVSELNQLIDKIVNKKRKMK